MVPLVPKLAVMTPARVLPVPMAPIMLSPPPALTSTSGIQTELLGGGSLEAAGRLSLRDERREFAAELGINGIQHGLGPFALADVQQGGAAGVAIFHHPLAGEPEIQVIVGQQHGGESLVVLRFMLLQPENFGSGKAGQDGVARCA